jgi:hypothetical protein
VSRAGAGASATRASKGKGTAAAPINLTGDPDPSGKDGVEEAKTEAGYCVASSESAKPAVLDEAASFTNYQLRIANVPRDLSEAKAKLIELFRDQAVVLLATASEHAKELSDSAKAYVDEFTDLLKSETPDFFNERPEVNLTYVRECPKCKELLFYESQVQVVNMARRCTSDKNCPMFCGWCGMSCKGISATEHVRRCPSSESQGHLLATKEEASTSYLRPAVGQMFSKLIATNAVFTTNVAEAMRVCTVANTHLVKCFLELFKTFIYSYFIPERLFKHRSRLFIPDVC